MARLLVIGGSDSGAGAGIQADVKTAMALGAYATTIITAITAQNTIAVRAILPLPPDMVEAQFRAVFEDIGADAIKIGMLGAAGTVLRVAALVAEAGLPTVLDPILMSGTGARLLDTGAVDTLREELIPRATLLTPNVPEAECLLGCRIRTAAQQRGAAVRLLELGAPAVLLKGGHLPGSPVADILATQQGITELAGPRLRSRGTHGTGCTLATAIAAGLARGLDLHQATARARAYVQAAIAAAPGLGAGQGPLQHAVPPPALI